MARACPYCAKDNGAVPALAGGRFYCIACGLLSIVDQGVPGGLRRATRAERNAALSDPAQQAARRAHLAQHGKRRHADKEKHHRAG